MTAKKAAAKKTASKPAKVAVTAPPLGLPVHAGSQEEFDLGTRVEMVFPLIEMQPKVWTLPPYSGKRVRCAKCGHGASEKDAQTHTLFHDVIRVGSPCWDLMQSDMDLFQSVGFPEHLDRRCPVCQFAWVEALATLDFKPNGGED